jgi:hypothetical protein
MAALNFLSERLGLAPAHFLGGEDARWLRIEADLSAEEWGCYDLAAGKF